MPEQDDPNSFAPLLDQEQLEMLVEAGGDDSTSLLDEIFDLFETESEEKLAELKRFRNEGEFDQLGKAAHALAGSSANIGGKELARKAKEIENLCKTQQGTEAAILVEGLESVYWATISALNTFAGRS